MAGGFKLGQFALAGTLVGEDPQDQAGNGERGYAIGGGNIKGVCAHIVPRQKWFMSMFPAISLT